MRKKQHKVSAWLTYDAFSHIGKVMKLRHLRQTDAIEYILTHEDTTPQELLIYRQCKNRDAYPQDPNFCRCYKDDAKKGRLIEQDVCQTCGLLKVIEVPLKTVEKLKQEEKELHAKIANHRSELTKLKEEYQTVNAPELQSKLESALTLNGEKDKTIKTLKGELAYLQTDIEQLREQLREQSQLSKIEPKIEYRDRIVEKPQYIEKTVKETVEKVVYKDRLEGLKILCNMGKGLVSLTDECLQKCQDVVNCSYHYSIVREKTIPEDAKLQFP